MIMKTYVVKDGDTLTTIAQRVYRNWTYWIDIYINNMPTIADDPRNKACIAKFGGIPPHWIFTDQVLKLRFWPRMKSTRPTG